MAFIIGRDEIPSHIFNIRELDFSDDLLCERLPNSWVKLAARTLESGEKDHNIEDDIFRQSILFPLSSFAKIFKKLESIGNLVQNLGKPVIWTSSKGTQVKRHYSAFYDFGFPFPYAHCEPIIFLYSDTSITRFCINPDLWMFLELEEKSPGKGIWWDPRRGVEALIHRIIPNSNLETVEIRPQYLLKYLNARQRSLVIAHYRQKLFFNPPQTAIDAFVKEDLILGSAKQGAKVILQNWGFRKDTHSSPYLQRRLHLWLEIRPVATSAIDPSFEQPSFDPYTFTFPTAQGPVAPGRWKSFPRDGERSYEGETCDFLHRICFRQEVLAKYEGNSGYEVKDDGSVSCYYWGLDRSTCRIGNELLETAIGDFAECVPFEEWLHWKEYAVAPPDLETIRMLAQEQAIPDAVNSVVQALECMNAAFSVLASTIGVSVPDALWLGTLDSLAGRQLKWVYLACASDDEFLKRVTLASTLFLDGLKTSSLRLLLKTIGKDLHQSFEKPPKPLGSRNLLQRLSLISVLIAELIPNLQDIPDLVQRAEREAKDCVIPDLERELGNYYQQIRDEFASLAFLYELRNYGGLAHPADPEGVAMTAGKLGLPQKNWHRTDYLQFLNIISNSINKIAVRLETAAMVIQSHY